MSSGSIGLLGPCIFFYLACKSFLLASAANPSITPITYNRGHTSKNSSETVPLPNFYSHVIGNRDEYKLIVPTEYQLPQLAEGVSVLAKQNQMRKLSGSLEKSNHTNFSKENLDVKTVDATFEALHRLMTGMYEQYNQEQGFVRIANSTIPRNKVTHVGDIDGNGIADYVVSNVAARTRRGTIRLYLMAPEGSFYYTRELVPGQWGFDSLPLQPGDRFGTVVTALPVSPHGAEYSLIAVGAPGEKGRNTPGQSGTKRGHVYIIKVSRKGNVLNNVKLPWAAFQNLVREYEHAAEEVRHLGNGSKEDEFDDQSAFMDAVEGVRTVVFHGKDGAIRAALRVDDTHGRKLLWIMDRFVKETPVNRLHRATFWHPTLRIAMLKPVTRPTCFFTSTECSCKLGSSASQCFQAAGPADKDGNIPCTPRNCEASYTCACDGSKVCKRVQRETFVLERTPGTQVCRQVKKKQTLNVLENGVSSKAAADSLKTSSCIFNEHKCSCELAESGASCYQALELADDSERIPCSPRQCEAAYSCECHGNKICRREERETKILQLITVGPSGEHFCHEVTKRRLINIVTNETLKPKHVAKPSPHLSPSPNLSLLNPFNATHCICSPPAEDAPTTTDCLHYAYTISATAILCKIARCAINDGYVCDTTGQNYCERHSHNLNIYVNDGEFLEEPGLIYCHRETLKKENLVRIM